MLTYNISIHEYVYTKKNHVRSDIPHDMNVI